MRSLWGDRLHLGFTSVNASSFLAYKFLYLDRKLSSETVQSLSITLVRSQAQNVPGDESHTHKSTEQMNNYNELELCCQESLSVSLNKTKNRKKFLSQKVLSSTQHS